MGYGSRAKFFHDLILIWIRSDPKRFMDILARYKSWIWLKGTPVFVQIEWRGMSKWDRRIMFFYDVYMKVYAPYRDDPHKMRYYHIFIEVKTGTYSDQWLEQLEKEYAYKSHNKLNPHSDDYPILLFIARGSEIEKLRTKLKSERGSYPTGYLLFFELEKLMPYILSSVSELFDEFRGASSFDIKQ